MTHNQNAKCYNLTHRLMKSVNRLRKDVAVIQYLDMVKYRRYQVPSGTYFFTVALQDIKSKYLTEHTRELGEAIPATYLIR